MLALMTAALVQASAGAGVDTFTLAGGGSLTVMAINSPTTTMTLRFRAGLEDEYRTVNLCRIAREALLQANRRLKWASLRRGLFEANATLTTGSTIAGTSYTLTANNTDFPALMERLVSGILKPDLDPRGVARLIETPPAGFGVAEQLDTFAIGLVEREVTEQPAPLSANILSSYVAAAFGAANLDVFIAGEVDVERTRAVLDQFKGGKRRDTPRFQLAGSRNVTVRGRSEEDLLMMAFDRSNVDAMAALRTLTEVLTALLFEPLRNQGAAYSIIVYPYLSDWVNLLVLHIPVVDSQKFNFKTSVGSVLDVVRGEKLDPVIFEGARAKASQQLASEARDSTWVASCLTRTNGDARWCGPQSRPALATLSLETFNREAKRFLVGGFAYELHVRVVPP